jgi:hypothetical protein
VSATVSPGISRVVTNLTATGRGTSADPLVIVPTGNVVDLRTQYGVIADDSTAGAANVAAINTAITDLTGTGTTLLLPPGDIYVDKAGTNWSIYFGAGTSDLVLAGAGQFSTTIVQHGTGTGNDWVGIRIDQSARILLRDFGIRQGTIKIPSAGQHDHLIYVTNVGAASTDECDQIYGRNLYFGKCLGDCLAFVGETYPITNIGFDGIVIEADGFVQQAWAPTTAYALGEQVRNGGTTGTSTSVAADTLTNTGVTMTVNQYQGATLVDSAGRRWAIASHTATVFTLTASGSTPSAGAYTVTGLAYTCTTAGTSAGSGGPTETPARSLMARACGTATRAADSPTDSARGPASRFSAATATSGSRTSTSRARRTAALTWSRPAPARFDRRTSVTG